MWAIKDAAGPDFAKTLEELEKGPDRTVAVVAGAIVDSYLTDALKKELQRDNTPYSKEIQSLVFQPDGPLGNFGPKIWMAYLLGFFSKLAHEDLQNFKNIRNLFAHFSEHNSFNTQKIKDRCNNFQLINTHIDAPAAWIGTGGKTVPIDTIGVHQNKVHLGVRDHEELLKIPKGRFVCTAKLFCAAFALYSHPEGNLKKPIL